MIQKVCIFTPQYSGLIQAMKKVMKLSLEEDGIYGIYFASGDEWDGIKLRRTKNLFI